MRIGEHITLDILGTQKEYDVSFYEDLVHKISKAAQVEVLQIAKHKFEPQGLTLVALLGESHMSFHTFPEHGIISFDFFTCGKVHPRIAIDILKQEIEHTKIIKKEFNRSTQEPSFLYNDVDHSRSAGIKKSYVVKSELENFTSKAGQHIEILDLEGFGTTLFIDNDLQVASQDEHLYSSTFVNAGLKLNGAKDKVAIIGGGDGGVARECLSQNFDAIDWYELDPEVVQVCDKYLSKVGNNALKHGAVKCTWGDAFESIKSIADNTYDQIFVDLNDTQDCIDLVESNIEALKRVLKPNGVITAQVGSQDLRPKQVENWLKVFNHEFGNATLDKIYIPSFDCHWNFASSRYTIE
jgi:spermidine synthase